MESMTEEEAFALDEYYTKNPPKVDPSKARIRIPMVRIDDVTAEYLTAKAKESKETPEEILGSLVREKIAMYNTHASSAPLRENLLKRCPPSRVDDPQGKQAVVDKLDGEAGEDEAHDFFHDKNAHGAEKL
jgi:hypothetical protein